MGWPTTRGLWNDEIHEIIGNHGNGLTVHGGSGNDEFNEILENQGNGLAYHITEGGREMMISSIFQIIEEMSWPTTRRLRRGEFEDLWRKWEKELAGQPRGCWHMGNSMNYEEIGEKMTSWNMNCLLCWTLLRNHFSLVDNLEGKNMYRRFHAKPPPPLDFFLAKKWGGGT